jgi:hypothetical protein
VHNDLNCTCGDMQHNDSNFSCGDMSCSDNDGDFSIDYKNIKEQGNLIVDDGGGKFISTQAQQQAHKIEVSITVGYHKSKISGG